MKSVKRSLEIFQSIIQNIENNFNELCGYWNIYEKQRFFVSAISIYDDCFLKTLESQSSKDDKSYYHQIIKYGYPTAPIYVGTQVHRAGSRRLLRRF